MPVRWDAYLELRARNRSKPIPEEKRRAIADLAAAVLGLGPEDAAAEWGEAIGYGLYAPAVIRVSPHIRHAYRDRCPAVAVKVFNGAADAFVRFQRDVFRTARFPHVQRTLDAGLHTDGRGKVRGYVVLEYVEGRHLDWHLEAAAPIGPAQARHLLGSFFQGLLIPLWAEGYRFWDFHPGNLIVHPTGSELTLIDTDGLRKSMDELAHRPGDWTDRDGQEKAAWDGIRPGKVLDGYLPRLAGLVLQAQAGQRPARVREAVQTAVAAADLRDALHPLSRAGPGSGRAEALAAFDRFLRALAAEGVLPE